MSTHKDNRIVQAYLFFPGNGEEAVEFYRQALGAQVELALRYKDAPDAPLPGMLAPGYENKVMHTSFRIGQTVVMASDGCGTEQTSFQGFSLSLTVPTEAEAERYFNALLRPGPLKCSTAVPPKEIGCMLKSGWLATTP